MYSKARTLSATAPGVEPTRHQSSAAEWVRLGERKKNKKAPTAPGRLVNERGNVGYQPRARIYHSITLHIQQFSFE